MTTREQAIEAIRAAAVAQSDQDARQFLKTESDRIETLTVNAAGFSFDFSRHAVSLNMIEKLVGLAEATGMSEAIDLLANGAPVNNTEGRAAQHMALRGAGDPELNALASAESERVFTFADAVVSGDVSSVDGKSFTHILHIGIGGSDLGPRLLYDALAAGSPHVDVRFLSSVDPDAFARATADLDPARTLVFVVSKSFRTPETTLNLNSALDWLRKGIGEAAGQHLAAVTSNIAAAQSIGIDEDRLFAVWDWVGGRFSLWSAVSLPVIAAIGTQEFRAFLAGAREMDKHFCNAPIASNAPVMSALFAWWSRQIRQCQSWAIVPYSIRLRLLNGWMQQLSMESLGKSVNLSGETIVDPAGHVVWGGEGPDAQHAFFQLLHQGREAIPADLIVFAKGSDQRHQNALLANAVAQAEALLNGQSTDIVIENLKAGGMTQSDMESLASHRVMPGGRGSTFILGKQLDARSLGALLAYYEHQTYALAVLNNINAFDQFGVELGKRLASTIEHELDGSAPAETRPGHDLATHQTLARIRTLIQSERD